jgi:glyoxylase-like metal-dependent hydrolase (beta-lactamase superfamily II)
VIAEAIDELGYHRSDLRRLLLTHFHEDHVGSAADIAAWGDIVTAPGHTPGSVAFYLPEPRVLFTGDTIARSQDGKVILGVFNVDPIQAVTSFKRQARLDTEIACFGHGEPLTDNAAAQLTAAAEPLSG